MKRIFSSEIIDTITTILQLGMTVLSIIISISAYIVTNDVINKASSLLDDMPDGSGVADGYIVLGKFFGSVGTGFASVVMYIIFLVGCVFSVLGIVFSVIYLLNRYKYNKTMDTHLLRRNIIIKTVVNAISILLFVWIMIENHIYSIWLIGLVVIMLSIEYVFITDIRSESVQ